MFWGVDWNAESIMGMIGTIVGTIAFMQVRKMRMYELFDDILDLEEEKEKETDPEKIKKIDEKLAKLQSEAERRWRNRHQPLTALENAVSKVIDFFNYDI